MPRNEVEKIIAKKINDMLDIIQFEYKKTYAEAVDFLYLLIMDLDRKEKENEKENKK